MSGNFQNDLEINGLPMVANDGGQTHIASEWTEAGEVWNIGDAD